MADPTADQIADLLHERAIARLILRVGKAQDARDWDLYRDCFDDHVVVEQPMDPTWVPEKVSAADWARRAASTLDGFDLTQHCLVNPLIELTGDTATATVELVARHEIDEAAPDGVYTLGGRYHIAFRLRDAGWRITSRRLDPRWESGNRGLMDLARARVAERGAGARPAFR